MSSSHAGIAKSILSRAMSIKECVLRKTPIRPAAMRRSKALQAPAVQRLLRMFLQVKDWRRLYEQCLTHPPTATNTTAAGVGGKQAVASNAMTMNTDNSSSSSSSNPVAFFTEFKNILKFQI